MDEIEWWEFDSRAELAEQVAGDIGFVIESAIEAHDGARIALPGAAIPDEVYAALAKRSDLDWTKVTLIPVADRLVSLGDDDSAFQKLETMFGPKGATIVSLVDEAALDDYREAGRLADARLAMIHWPLDLVCLGVDDDGHTAGLLPGPDFDRAVAGPRERRAVGIHPEDGSGDRITLTTAAISSARAVMIVLAGDTRRARLEQAIKDGPLSSLAIGRVIGELDASIDIFWSGE